MKLKPLFSKISSAITILLVILIPFALSNIASAGTFTDSLCKGYGVFNGPLGKMMAVFAIVALGVGLFLGKITWGLVIAVAMGIAAIFGAPKLVEFMTGSPIGCTTNASTASDV